MTLQTSTTHLLTFSSVPNSLLFLIIPNLQDSDPSGLIVTAILQRQLIKKKAKGTIIKTGPNEYKIRCYFCGDLIQAANQKRGKKVKKRNWAAQPYFRHLERKHPHWIS